MSERASMLLTVVMLVVVAIMMWMALDFTEEARRVPLVVGIPTVVLLLLQLGRDVAAKRFSSTVMTSTGDDEASAEAADPDEGPGAATVAEDAGPAATSEPQPTVDDEAAVGGGKTDDNGDAPLVSAQQAFLWIGALGVIFYLFGMLLTVPIFLGLFMRFYGREKLWLIGVVVVATMSVLYVGFVVLLEVQLYPGVVTDWLGL